MRLDVSEEDIHEARFVCADAVNLSLAKAVASRDGPRAGMRRLFGRRVKSLPEDKGAVFDRAIALTIHQAKKRRGPGRSGRSNWPKGSKEDRTAEMNRRAEKRAEDAAAALKDSIDDGKGPYKATLQQAMAIRRVREQVGRRIGVAAERLLPSATVAVTTLAPTSIPAFVDGAVVSLDDSLVPMSKGDVMTMRRGASLCKFTTAGSRIALTFRLTE